MKKEKRFPETLFTPEILRTASEKLIAVSKDPALSKTACRRTLDIGICSEESWAHDNQDEFFADYRKDHEKSLYGVHTGDCALFVHWQKWCRETSVTVEASSRADIESIFSVFENNLASCKLPKKSELQPKEFSPRIFIGHGQSPQWKTLKDHLHDQHGYEVEAYEIGARAGHVIRDILEDMLSKSSFAILVMTGEDKGENGNLRARQNVVHELGLFQGKIGFSRAIVLLEEDTEEFSNIHGIHQLRYRKNNIKEVFGDVLATLRREFSSERTQKKSEILIGPDC